MRRPRLIAGLLLAAMFAVGAVVGAAVTAALGARQLTAVFEGPPQGTVARAYGWRLRWALHLSRAQEAEVVRIVQEDHDEAAAVRREAEPRLVEIRRRRHERIRSVLSRDQQRAFDQLVTRYEAQRRQELGISP
jgi:hypothetical protein